METRTPNFRNEAIILFSLAGILVLGIGAQWLSWRLKLPSILLLLGFGFLAGPITQLLNPDAIFHEELLFPLVSISVGLILFEGGLSLRLRDLEHIGKPLRNLLTIGVIITLGLITLTAFLVLGMSLGTSLILGAILVVTGPTVIGPLLKHIRPTGPVGPIARWEGIIIDPIGAILAVLVFEIRRLVVLQLESEAIWEILLILGRTIVIGGGLGTIGAFLLLFMFRRYLVPDALQNPMVFAVGIGVFAGSNVLQHESGLVAVTIMGVLLANQKTIVIKHIIEFKENISVLLLSTLFILLAARIDREQLMALDWRAFVFVILLILLIRPVAVFTSTIKTKLRWQEKMLLAWLAPRGIVAAAVASLFALRMGEAGQGLVPVVFLVIVATVVVYGLTAPALAKWLGLAIDNPQGVLMASAHPGARAIALGLKSANIPVILIDTNWSHVQTAKLEGLRAYYGSVLAKDILEEIDLGNMGRFLALTANDEVNSLAARQMVEAFGTKEVYQLVPATKGPGRTNIAAEHLHGRLLFSPEATYDELDQRFARGAIVKKTRLTKEFDYTDFQEEYGAAASPLFSISPTGILTVCTANKSFTPQIDHTLISLVYPSSKKKRPNGEMSAP